MNVYLFFFVFIDNSKAVQLHNDTMLFSRNMEKTETAAIKEHKKTNIQDQGSVNIFNFVENKNKIINLIRLFVSFS